MPERTVKGIRISSRTPTKQMECACCQYSKSCKGYTRAARCKREDEGLADAEMAVEVTMIFSQRFNRSKKTFVCQRKLSCHQKKSILSMLKRRFVGEEFLEDDWGEVLKIIQGLSHGFAYIY